MVFPSIFVFKEVLALIKSKIADFVCEKYVSCTIKLLTACFRSNLQTYDLLHGKKYISFNFDALFYISRTTVCAISPEATGLGDHKADCRHFCTYPTEHKAAA